MLLCPAILPTDIQHMTIESDLEVYILLNIVYQKFNSLKIMSLTVLHFHCTVL